MTTSLGLAIGFVVACPVGLIAARLSPKSILMPGMEGVLDLLWKSKDPSMRKDFERKQVGIIGQGAHRKNARHERGPFQLVRFVMVGCAADVQPLAVLVEYSKSSPDFESMSWVKVEGKVRFFSIWETSLRPRSRPQRQLRSLNPPNNTSTELE